MKKKYLIISTVCLLLSSGMHSQVTIGSNQPPATGALLDLKEGAVTTKGLGMPRVKLSDMAKLKMGTNEILDADNGGNQYTKHTGLIVYNISGAPIPKCAPIPDGLYVWDGAKWNGINVFVNPTIEQWALIAGFTQTQINTVKTTGADSPIRHTGIQLHRDQSNNLFLSSSFHATDITGNSERWMIHNLAATKFDAGQAYTGGATLVGKRLRPHNADGIPPGTPASTMDANASKNPYYAYPNGGSNNGSMTTTSYDNNPRLGLLYTWDAATAGKGGTNGLASFNESEPTTHIAVQGICPDGWHLPSDVEWTTLERELNTHTSKYSSTEDIGGTFPEGPGTNRGTLHGRAMKDICKPPDDWAKTHQGTSNGISSTARPGFDVLLAGFCYNGSARDFGTAGFFWLASGAGPSAWIRGFSHNHSWVARFYTDRHNLFPVRCKKN